MSANVTYIVDDQDDGITYLCSVQHQTVLGSYFKNTWTTITDNDCGQQWFKYDFTGTAVSVAAPAAKFGQNYTVQIDDGPALRPYGRGFYDSGHLEDGEHTILYALGDETLNPAFDYLTVTAGPSTSLQNRNIIIDDEDNGPLTWSGDWKSSPPSMLVFDYSNAPYKDSVHWSNNVGDTMELTFVGTSVSVYGILTANTSGGDIIATYTIDGEPTVMALPEGLVNQTIPMACLYTTELPAGNHTLLVNITNISDPSHHLGIDFVVYNSSLDDLAAVQESWGVETSITPSGSTSVSHTSPPIGAIVGGVVGAIAFILLMILLFLDLKKRQMKKNRPPSRVDVIGKLETGSVESWHDMKKRPDSLTDEPTYLAPVLTKH